MKADIHPEYSIVEVVCSCGNTFQTGSTNKKGFKLEVCNECHPFYTGKHKVVDTAGRIDQFMRRYGSYKKGDAAKTGN